MSDLILIHGEDGKTFFVDKDEFLSHEGVVGMKWGHRNGPPYPLSRGILKIKTKMLEKQAKQANSSLHKPHSVDSPDEPDMNDTAALRKSTERMQNEARYVAARTAHAKQKYEAAHTISKVVSKYYNGKLTVAKAFHKNNSIRVKSLQHKVNILNKMKAAQEAGGKIVTKIRELDYANEAILMTDEELKAVTENLTAITNYKNMKSLLYGKKYAENLIDVASNVTVAGAESYKKTKEQMEWAKDLPKKIQATVASVPGKVTPDIKKKVDELEDKLEKINEQLNGDD